MAINLKSTNTVKMNGLKVLVYGMAGSGKTTLIKTLPAPVILSAEGGLLSISGEDLPYIEIKTMADLREAYGWLASSEEAKGFRSVALDNQILVTTSGDRIKLEQVKNKDGEIAEPVYLEKIPVHLPGWYDDDGEPVSTLILEPDEDGAEKETTKLTKSQHFGLQTYREAAEKYGLLDERGEFAGVNVEDWREVFYDRSPQTKQDTRKKNFQIARKELVELGELSCHDGIYQLSEDYELEKVYIKKMLQNRENKTGREK